MMTKIEKAKEIIRQGGRCTGVSCEYFYEEQCPCSSYCKEQHCGICVSEINKAERIEICEKYLKENAMEKQLFDKSKVLVAGIHKVDTQMLYIVGNNISELNGKIDGDTAFNPRKLESCNDLYLCERGNTWRFAYPYEEPVKTWRPIKTSEEAEPFLGKKIKRKDGRKMLMLITIIHVEDDSTLFLNGLPARSIFDHYTMEDGSPVGIEE